MTIFCEFSVVGKKARSLLQVAPWLATEYLRPSLPVELKCAFFSSDFDDLSKKIVKISEYGTFNHLRIAISTDIPYPDLHDYFGRHQKSCDIHL